MQSRHNNIVSHCLEQIILRVPLQFLYRSTIKKSIVPESQHSIIQTATTTTERLAVHAGWTCGPARLSAAQYTQANLDTLHVDHDLVRQRSLDHPPPLINLIDIYHLILTTMCGVIPHLLCSNSSQLFIFWSPIARWKKSIELDSHVNY